MLTLSSVLARAWSLLSAESEGRLPRAGSGTPPHTLSIADGVSSCEGLVQLLLALQELTGIPS